MACIAKLAWLIHTNPQSLWVQILKEKYFLTAHFLEAEVKANALWIWKGIMQTRPIIEEGWCILPGSGEVDIRRDPWLPIHPHGRPDWRREGLENPHLQVVADLVDHNSGTWDQHLIYASFEQQSAQLILGQPTLRPDGHDRIIWRADP